MGAAGVKLGVALGMAAAVASFFPLFNLTMGDCFFEQGCGERENVQLLGVVLASGVVGVFIAWLVARLARIMRSRGRQG